MVWYSFKFTLQNTENQFHLDEKGGNYYKEHTYIYIVDPHL